MVKPELEGRIQQKVQSGDYETVDELIESVLDRSDDDQAIGGMALAEVQDKIEEGWAAAERGDTISGEDWEAEMDAWRARVDAGL